MHTYAQAKLNLKQSIKKDNLFLSLKPNRAVGREILYLNIKNVYQKNNNDIDVLARKVKF